MKKILAIVLAVVMLLPVFAVNVFAAPAKKVLVVNSGRVTLELDEVVAKGESVDVHLKGTADGAFRFMFSKAASLGSNWNQSDIVKVTKASGKLADGAFDFTVKLAPTEDIQYILFQGGSGGGPIDGEDQFKELRFETIEVDGKALDFKTVNTSNGQAKVESSEPEPAIIEKVIYELDCGENGIARSGWDNIPVGVPAFKDAMKKENAKLVIEAEGVGGWSAFAIQVTGYKNTSVQLKEGRNEYNYDQIMEIVDKISKEQGKEYTFDDIIEFCSNGDPYTIKSFKVVATVEADYYLEEQTVYEYDCGEEGYSYSGWTETDIPPAAVAEALTKQDAKIVLEVKEMGNWAQMHFQVDSSTGWKTFMVANLAKGVNEIPVATILEKMEATDPSLELKNLVKIVLHGDPATVSSFKVVATVAVPLGKKVSKSFAFVYINEKYHAYSSDEFFIPMPHDGNEFGLCNYCHEIVETEGEDDANKPIYAVEATQSQDFSSSATIADGITLVDTQSSGEYCRIATNWVSGGSAWTGITNAINNNPDAWVKITYTGSLDAIVIECEKDGVKHFEVTEPATVEEGEQNVAWFKCSDIIANSPNGLSGSFSWANFMLKFSGDTTVTGIEVVNPEIVPGE